MDNRRISGDALGAVFRATASTPVPISRREAVMGGHGTVTLVGGTEQLLDDTWGFINRCEELWSRFRESSDITRLNWAEGKPVEVDHLTVTLLEAMMLGAELSAGAYNPTLLPDVLALGYETSQVDTSVTSTLPASAKAPGNLAGITIADTIITLPVGTTLDPGGIGKGLAADLAAQFALTNGAQGVMVELGGDIAVAGTAPDSVAWRLGVEDPFGETEHLTVVRLSAGGVVTSSQRKRRFGTSKNPTHHLVDVSTHHSAQTSVQTVTVLAATAARAEAIAKAGFMRDPQDFLNWLPSVGAAGMVVLENRDVECSDNWSQYQ